MQVRTKLSWRTRKGLRNPKENFGINRFIHKPLQASIDQQLATAYLEFGEEAASPVDAWPIDTGTLLVRFGGNLLLLNGAGT